MQCEQICPQRRDLRGGIFFMEVWDIWQQLWKAQGGLDDAACLRKGSKLRGVVWCGVVVWSIFCTAVLPTACCSTGS
jgi:hypothetical protein